MIIGIDISQMVYEGTGVSRYVTELTRIIIQKGTAHTFVLFGSSLRKKNSFTDFYNSFSSTEKTRIKLVTIFLPLKILDVLWNRFHIFPIEFFTGKVDIFWSSDWTQPPLRNAKGVTTIHDMTPVRFPETFPKEIIDTHKRKLEKSRDACNMFFCDSDATRHDAEKLLGLPANKLVVVYPGFTPTL